MSTPRPTKCALLCSAAIATLTLVGASPVQGQVLYQENFNNSSGTNANVSSVGWEAFRGTTATTLTNGVSDGTTQGTSSIAGSAGNPNPPNGYLFASNGNAAQHAFAMVDVFSTGITVPMLSGVNEISFTMGNTDLNSTVRILIQIGGNGTVGSGIWYASTVAFIPTSTYSAATYASAPTASVTYSLDFTTAAGAWRAFTLNPDVAMSIGAVTSTALSTDTITGIGFYASPGYLQQSVRVDNLTVVPEPGTVSMLALGGLMVLGLLRRRRLV